MSFKWNAEKVCEACGLESFEKFAEYSRGLKRFQSPHVENYFLFRQTGRTVKMCCEAVAGLLNGRIVTILCVNLNSSVEKKIDGLLKEIVEPEQHKELKKKLKLIPIGIGHDLIFVDNACTD